MEVADNLGSLDVAFVVVADKSQHYESNGSSKQHVEQMRGRKVDAFAHKPLHMEPVDWRLAGEPHVVSEADSLKVNVYVNFAAATIDGCKLVAVVHDDKNDNYSHSSSLANAFGLKLLIVLVTTVVSTHVSAHALLLFPFRSKMFGAELCLNYLQWEYEAV